MEYIYVCIYIYGSCYVAALRPTHELNLLFYEVCLLLLLREVQNACFVVDSVNAVVQYCCDNTTRQFHNKPVAPAEYFTATHGTQQYCVVFSTHIILQSCVYSSA